MIFWLESDEMLGLVVLFEFRLTEGGSDSGAKVMYVQIEK